MIAEHSFWFESRRPWEHIGDTIADYDNCLQRKSIRPTIDRLFKTMNHQNYTFGLEGPLQSPSLQKLAIIYTPLLLHHRLPPMSSCRHSRLRFIGCYCLLRLAYFTGPISELVVNYWLISTNTACKAVVTS
ncbi:hypothetical protein GYMLUDRAFT_833395 [Collybiopsis luxurians FD-317 M1]|uniref:Unplaced genomic scaffold GYMLUscaffold_56, whole genome shotgun sequence n=1 Tax=Collybiopsis luxurians FD-317 M1 TaxID=944289 RepID=A0A0D0CKJ4_9AGAR|nr:hypothetical protein GYMLUDRAFT_833395 [Collybiopsis luxurians FD-317 M1]